MSNGTFQFKPGTAQDVASVLQSKQGQAALQQAAHDFSSLAAEIASAHLSNNGHSLTFTLPNHQAVTVSLPTSGELQSALNHFGHPTKG